jgi:hypothetical protein
MSINFNDPRARSEFRDLRRDTFTAAEYEQAIKGLVRLILQYFWDDAEFLMITTMGADAVFQVKMVEGKKPKKTINLGEAPSPMSMMQMMYGGDTPFKSESDRAEWRFSAYLDLYKKLKIMYPDGPESVLSKTKDIINKYKKPLADGPKVKKPEDSKAKTLYGLNDLGTIPVPPGWDSVITQMGLPKTLPSKGELYPNHGDQIFEMKVHYDGPSEEETDPDYEEARRQALGSCVAGDSTKPTEFIRKDDVLDSICEKITEHDGCNTLDEREEVINLLGELRQHLEENPVKLTVRGNQIILEIEVITLQRVDRVDYWWVGFKAVEGIEALIMIHEPETVYVVGNAEGMKIS